MSVTRVLVANRGEIAVRVIRACQSLGIETVAAVSDADRESMAAEDGNRAVCIGPARSTDSYLKVENLIAAAQGTGCDAFIPVTVFFPSVPRWRRLASTTKSLSSVPAPKTSR